MILSISLKRLCSGFGRTDIGYVTCGIIELFITVTFPYNVKFLLPQERTILLFSLSFLQNYILSDLQFFHLSVQLSRIMVMPGEKLCVQISIFDFPSGANSDLLQFNFSPPIAVSLSNNLTFLIKFPLPPSTICASFAY